MERDTQRRMQGDGTRDDRPAPGRAAGGTTEVERTQRVAGRADRTAQAVRAIGEAREARAPLSADELAPHLDLGSPSSASAAVAEGAQKKSAVVALAQAKTQAATDQGEQRRGDIRKQADEHHASLEDDGGAKAPRSQEPAGTCKATSKEELLQRIDGSETKEREELRAGLDEAKKTLHDRMDAQRKSLKGEGDAQDGVVGKAYADKDAGNAKRIGDTSAAVAKAVAEHKARLAGEEAALDKTRDGEIEKITRQVFDSSRKALLDGVTRSQDALKTGEAQAAAARAEGKVHADEARAAAAAVAATGAHAGDDTSFGEVQAAAAINVAEERAQQCEAQASASAARLISEASETAQHLVSDAKAWIDGVKSRTETDRKALHDRVEAGATEHIGATGDEHTQRMERARSAEQNQWKSETALPMHDRIDASVAHGRERIDAEEKSELARIEDEFKQRSAEVEKRAAELRKQLSDDQGKDVCSLEKLVDKGVADIQHASEVARQHVEKICADADKNVLRAVAADVDAIHQAAQQAIRQIDAHVARARQALEPLAKSAAGDLAADTDNWSTNLKTFAADQRRAIVGLGTSDVDLLKKVEGDAADKMKETHAREMTKLGSFSTTELGKDIDDRLVDNAAARAEPKLKKHADSSEHNKLKHQGEETLKTLPPRLREQAFGKFDNEDFDKEHHDSVQSHLMKAIPGAGEMYEMAQGDPEGILLGGAKMLAFEAVPPLMLVNTAMELSEAMDSALDDGDYTDPSLPIPKKKK